MNSKTRQLIREIHGKIKSSLTGNREFVNEDAVIDHAINLLYQQLKKQRLL